MSLEDVRILNNSLELIQNSQDIQKSILPLKQKRGADLLYELEFIRVYSNSLSIPP